MGTSEKRATKSRASRTAALEAQLRESETNSEILSALAACVWHNSRFSGKCPPNLQPSEEELARFLLNEGLSQDEIDSYRARMRQMLELSKDFVEEDGRRQAAHLTIFPALQPAVFGWVAPYVDRWFENLPALHDLWDVTSANSSEPLRHPVAVLVRAWQKRPRPAKERHLITPAHGLVRSPALVSHALLSPLEIRAVMVDGVPVGSPRPNMRMTTYRRLKPSVGEMRASPRTLRSAKLDDAVLATLARYPLTGDERSPLRSDVYRLALFACALTGPVTLSEREGVKLLTGSDALTTASKRRWWDATEWLRAFVLTINPHTHEWIDFAQLWRTADGRVSLGPPAWMDGGKIRFALSGALFRSAQLGPREGRGTTLGYWGSLHRLIAGLEAALSYGRSAGRGRDGRIPDALRPANGRGGPGTSLLVPWRNIISLCGEPITKDNEATARVRYHRRTEALEVADYVCKKGAPAHAADTVEIERIQKGNRWRSGGLWVRASARFVEATKIAQTRANWERVPADRALIKLAD